MGMGIKHRNVNGNGKLPQWEWELPALPWEFIPKGRRLLNDLYCAEWDVKLYNTIPYYSQRFYAAINALHS